ncbi:uncharacterized protein LOC106179262 [Lingula anatina]|uniref:Uncharacterized protein LOC106179262 n=1 Tax=Lingula anatina TaxID=7574 RepID=A0A1S3K740_LINAN|nr:uncharacterized protein LOC106179262 [Lingula anatina]|eukprot:XP_013418259.1 uncharacterized protein LOC106179262 [Lingula anatina]
MATSRSRSVQDSYHFTVVYDGCLSGDDKTDSIKLSYEFVEKLKGKARKQGINCFLPHQMIKGGQMEMREIYSAVENSDHVILVMTEGYLEKMCGKKSSDSQNDPDLMLQQIHYNIIDHKIYANTDGIIVVPIYLQTRKKEISLGAYRSIQFRKKEDWEDEENWEKIWNLIPKDLQPSVLTGSAVSSQGSSEPDAGESGNRKNVSFLGL